MRRLIVVALLAAGSLLCFVLAALLLDVAAPASSTAAESAVRALAARLTDGRLSSFDEHHSVAPQDIDGFTLDVEQGDVRVAYVDVPELKLRAAGDIVTPNGAPNVSFLVAARQARLTLKRADASACEGAACLVQLVTPTPKVELFVPRSWSGSVALRTRDGNVKVDASRPFAGPLAVDAVDGNVKMKLGGPIGPVTVSAVNGNVRLRLGAGLAAALTVRTKEGRVKADAPWKGALAPDMDGDFTVLRGQVGAGGTPVNVTAEAGNVELRRL